MLALPSAAPPAPQRQLFFGTALACAGGATLMGGMLALWLQFRDQALASEAPTWVQMELPISDGTGSAYGVMFYAITGTFLVFLIIGLVFSFVTAFRYLGG